MSITTHALKTQLLRQPVSYRARVAGMDEFELLREFDSERLRLVGRELSLLEAGDLKFLLDRVLAVSSNQIFKVECYRAVRVLEQGMARLNN